MLDSSNACEGAYLMMEPPTQKHAGTYGRDRIGQLPDSILHHILSFLTTLEVVRMGILSRRWRNLWASIPYLDFSEDEFGTSKKARRNFELFVNAVLVLRDKSDMHTFRLEFSPCHLDISNTWIHHAVRHNAKVMSIRSRVLIHACIFSCQSLEELSLFEVKLCLPEFTSLERLRRLHLQSIDIGSGFMENLIPVCPVLEHLCLSACCVQNVDISSHTLKSLTIRYCSIYGSKIQLSIPSLKFLSCTNNSGENFEPFLLNLPSVVNACISHWTHSKYATLASNLVLGLASTRTLEFSSPIIECLLENEVSTFPTFHNLMILTLCGCHMGDNIHVVAYFLQHSPYLKVLNLLSGKASFSRPDINKEERQKSRKLLLHRPRAIEVNIQCYDVDEKVDDLVRLLQSNLALSVNMTTNF